MQEVQTKAATKRCVAVVVVRFNPKRSADNKLPAGVTASLVAHELWSYAL